MLLAPLGTLILSGVISAEKKSTLVYWRCVHSLPGIRVFTDYINSDDRIDKSRLTEKWGQLPTKLKEQNLLWYKIFKTCETHPAISGAHKAWLFSRDLTAYCFIFLVLFSSIILISDTKVALAIYYSIFLLLQYIICMFVSRNYGNKLVCDVLAHDSSN